MRCVKFWLKVLNNEIMREVAEKDSETSNRVQQGNLGEEHGKVCW